MQELFSALSLWLSAHPLITGWYTAIARLLFPVLSALILVRAIRSLLRIPHTPEVWAQLSLPGGGSIPLTHWENILGRGKSADAILNYPSISRQHAALCRGEDGAWTVYDLGSKGGTAVNGTPVTEQAPLKLGDTLTLGGVPLVFLPQTVGEREELEKKRQAERPAAMWPSFLWLTVFQILTAIQLTLAAGEKASPVIPICFLTLTAVMWLYAAALRLGRCVGFELETIAFYLSTLSLAVTASSAPGSLPKQLLAIVLGMGLFLALGLFLRDLERVKKRRWLMAAGAIGLLGITLVLGRAKFGATNWVTLGGISFQPSEIAKICYIFAGSATLERLFRRRNLALFIVLTGVCIGLLGLMSDFGTALIFFCAFLVIAYLRSGSMGTVALAVTALIFAGVLALKIAPHALRRFSVWRHVWDDPLNAGYQQVQALMCVASGGLFGLGPGQGFLKHVFAADSDIAFATISEEWGLIVAVMMVLCVAAYGFFAIRTARVARSSFYSIGSCTAASILVIQTILNCLGTLDILPFTGVTFPFLSNGGTSMVGAWGLLAFVKAADTRQNASFAVRLNKKGA